MSSNGTTSLPQMRPTKRSDPAPNRRSDFASKKRQRLTRPKEPGSPASRLRGRGGLLSVDRSWASFHRPLRPTLVVRCLPSGSRDHTNCMSCGSVGFSLPKLSCALCSIPAHSAPTLDRIGPPRMSLHRKRISRMCSHRAGRRSADVLCEASPC